MHSSSLVSYLLFFSSLVVFPAVSSHRAQYEDQKSSPSTTYKQFLWPFFGSPASNRFSSSNYYSPAAAASDKQYDYNNYNNYELAMMRDFSNRDDDEYEEHKKQLKVEHHELEGKEVSYMYPVLLALLILGALFIPFMSLFFFLAVSAFNCNSIGSGFGQVTPVFGRRRRRRKRSLSSDAEAIKLQDANGTMSTMLQQANAAVGRPPASPSLLAADYLPALMLFDAILEQNSNYSDSNADQLPLKLDQFSSNDHYERLRRSLARSTIKLGNALIKDWLFEDDEDDHLN